MTNLKAGAGPTREPVQGPHSVPILGVARWSFNWLFVDPPTVTYQGSILQKDSFYIFLWSSNWLSGKVSSGPASGCPAYIYIYICICWRVISLAPFAILELLVWPPWNVICLSTFGGGGIFALQE